MNKKEDKQLEKIAVMSIRCDEDGNIYGFYHNVDREKIDVNEYSKKIQDWFQDIIDENHISEKYKFYL